MNVSMKDWKPVNCERLYQSFLDNCRPYRLHGPWSLLGSKPDVWIPPARPTDTLQRLHRHWKRNDLFASRLAIPDENEEVMMNPQIVGPSATILPCRESPNGLPYDLVTQQGSLSGNLPALAALGGVSKTGLDECSGGVCMAFCVPDLAVLRMAGIVTTLASRLDQITGPSLTEFCKRFGVRRGYTQPGIFDGQRVPSGKPPFASADMRSEPLDSEAMAEWVMSVRGQSISGRVRWIPRLVLVGWTPSELQLKVPEELDKVIAHLSNIEKFLQIRFDELFVWRPSKEDLDRVCFCLEHGHKKDVRAALLESMAEAVPATEIAEAPSAPISLAEAQARLNEIGLGAPISREWRRRIVIDCERAIHSELLEPLWRYATLQTDAEERARVAGVAGLMKLVLGETNRLCAKLRRGTLKTGNSVEEEVSEKEWEHLLKLFKELSALTGGSRCKRRRARRKRSSRP